MKAAALLILLTGGAAAAQGLPAAKAGPMVRASLDTAIIRIGERAELTLTAHPATEGTLPAVVWPAIGDTLQRHVEVLRDLGTDTLHHTAGGPQLVRTLHITSFDTGFWAIPPFKAQVDGRTVETEAILLEVRNVERDPAIFLHDIRPIHELPFSLVFWLRTHAWWIAAVVAVGALALLLPALLRRLPKRTTAAPDPQAPPLPLHERVRAALLAVERERLWQQGLHKEYHSRVTDLVRGYVEERYGVPALERTTDELLQELRVSPLDDAQHTRLANMLRLADLVKFAKATPAPAENEALMAAALRFVDETADRSIAPVHAH